MSYATIEASVEDGQVVELYEFLRNSTYTRYCTTVAAVTFGSPQATYTGASIKRSQIQQSDDPFKNNISIELPRTDSFANGFISGPLDGVTTLTIYRGHVDDNDFSTYWKGRVIGAQADGNIVTLELESVFTSIQRPGLTAKYEYTCRHALYSDQCGVDKDDFDVAGTVSSITGRDVVVSAASGFADDYFTGGMILFDGVHRFITDHAGSTLTLSWAISGMSATDSVTLYPGCDHALQTCIDKFDNVENFGGFPWIPQRNPFDGRSIV